METILVGYDGAESDEALERAAELAQAFGASLVVVSVSKPPHLPVTVPVYETEPVTALPGTMGPVAVPIPPPLPTTEEPTEPKELAYHQLEQARRILSRRHVDAEYVAEIGLPAERLLDVADERGVDLIVVGSHKHRLLERLLVRPVHETVARRAEQDVLLVH